MSLIESKGLQESTSLCYQNSMARILVRCFTKFEIPMPIRRSSVEDCNSGLTSQNFLPQMDLLPVVSVSERIPLST